jgi:hypothetical protein
MTGLYGEVRNEIFQHEFSVLDNLSDIERTLAHLENGILSLPLPKQKKGGHGGYRLGSCLRDARGQF